MRAKRRGALNKCASDFLGLLLDLVAMMDIDLREERVIVDRHSK